MPMPLALSRVGHCHWRRLEWILCEFNSVSLYTRLGRASWRQDDALVLVCCDELLGEFSRRHVVFGWCCGAQRETVLLERDQRVCFWLGQLERVFVCVCVKRKSVCVKFATIEMVEITFTSIALIGLFTCLAPIHHHHRAALAGVGKCVA